MHPVNPQPKFPLLTGDYQDVLDFAAFLHNDISRAMPDVFFYREPERPTAEDVYNYLREGQRDAQEQVSELADRLLYNGQPEDFTTWQHLTDLEPADERRYVEAAAQLWLLSFTAGLAASPERPALPLAA